MSGRIVAFNMSFRVGNEAHTDLDASAPDLVFVEPLRGGGAPGNVGLFPFILALVREARRADRRAPFP